MSGDRQAHDDERQYRRVVAQEGRAIAEADLNEAQELLTEEIRKEALDLVGPSGTPDDGYALSFPASGAGAHEIHIGPGTMYVGGMRVYLPAEIAQQAQPEWLDAPPPPTSGAWPAFEYLYLRLIEQEVSATEDRPQREVGMGSPDSAPHTRLTQHVVRGAWPGMSTPTCDGALAQVTTDLGSSGLYLDAKTMRIASKCTLQAQFVPPSPSDVRAPAHLEKRLLRVQISGPRTLLWGYDEVSSLYRVASVAVDTSSTVIVLASSPIDGRHAPQVNQYVEVLRAGVDLGDGDYVVTTGSESDVRQVAMITASYDPSARTITIDAALPAIFSDQIHSATVFLRLWQEQLDFVAGTPSALGAPVPLGNTGVQVSLQAPDAPGDIFPVGEFWRFALRPYAPAKVFPQRCLESPQPPDGPRQWICLLGIAAWTGGVGSVLHDCRQKFDGLGVRGAGAPVSTPTPSTVAIRNETGQLLATSFSTSSLAVASAGVVRLTSTAQSAIAQKSSVNGANDVVGLAFDGSDNVLIGDTVAAGWVTVRSAASGFRVQDASGVNRLAVDFAGAAIALGWDVNVGSHRLTNLATPTSASDAVTKAYADALVPVSAVDPTTSTVATRDGAGQLRGTSFAISSVNVASAGVVRLTSAAQSAISQKSSVNGANDVVGLAFDGSDNVLIGDTVAAGWVTVRSAASGFRIQDASGVNRLAVDFARTTISLGWDVDVGSHRLTNVATPTSASDAVTKAYADARLPILVGGIASAASSTFTVIGRAQFDATTFPTGTSFKFQAIVEATPGQTTEVRLYNVTDAAVIAGSTLSTSSTTPTLSNVAVTLPAASKMYEVQLRLAATPAASDRATCTRAELTT